jgi:Family of unknown function (DUF6335)
MKFRDPGPASGVHLFDDRERETDNKSARMPRHQRRKAKHAERRSVEIEDGGKLVSSIEDVVHIVDEIGRALGVEREDDEEVTTSEEILKACDRRRWELEAEDAADEARGSRRSH